MAKLLEQYGTRNDGVRINFTDDESPLTKVGFEEFVSITRKVEMTREEFMEKYPKSVPLINE